jgi:diaminopimelate epimerase
MVATTVTSRSVLYLRLEGCGNNFIVINDTIAPHHTVLDDSHVVAAIQSKHFGVGGDGIMIIRPPRDPAREDFLICMRNPDGSPMGMCGNGIRCVMRALALFGLISLDTKEVRFDVEGRAIRCSSDDQGSTVSVAMGAYSIRPSDLPLIAPDGSTSALNITLAVDGFSGTAHGVSMGNPHAVFFVPDLTQYREQLSTIGPRLENHPRFPKRANIEFAQVISPTEIEAIVWERGAGITLACGTGACAIGVAAALNDLAPFDRPLTVRLPGGELEVTVPSRSADDVYLKGPAREIGAGEIVPQFFERRFPI